MSSLPFKILQIDHIGIAVTDTAPLTVFFQLLGLTAVGTEVISSQRVQTSMFDAESVHLELLTATDEQSTIAKYIEKHGEGVHHIAFRVDNLELALDYLSAAGIRLIDSTPRQGAGGKRIAFLHPKATGGVLVELSQFDTESSTKTTGETKGVV